jgi:trypsin-like peptidase
MNEPPLMGFEWNQADLPRENEAALCTVVAKDSFGTFHAVGAGFVVKATRNAAIALSAAHVLSEVQRLQRRGGQRSHATTLPEFSPPPPPIDVALSELAIVTRSDPAIAVSQVSGLAFDEAADIGLMQLVPQPDQDSCYPLREFLLESQIPRIGQLVCVASYMDLACANDGPGAFRVTRRAVMRVGRVLNVFPEGQRLCRGPCFETSIPLFSGMSGGAVFYYGTSGAMRVVGLVCSDPDLDGPQKNDRSISGRSLVACLPVERISGTPQGEQIVRMKFIPTSLAGKFVNDAGA